MTIFIAFLAAYLLSQFFRSFLAVIAPELAADTGMTAAGLGLVSSAWFAAFAVAQFPVGWALDTYGPRRTVPILMLFAVAGCMLFGAAGDTESAAIAMLLIGIGCAPIYMGALYYFGRTYPQTHFALISSWMLGLGSAGNLLAATPLAAATEAIGWRATFYVLAAVTALASVTIALLVRDPPKVAHDGTDRSLWSDFVELAGNRALWPLLPIALVSYAIVAVERGLWMGPYLADVYELSPIQRGNAALWMAGAMTAGALAYGPLDQWFGTRKWVVVGGTAVTAAAFSMLWLFPALPLTAAVALLAVIGAAGLTYGVLMAHARAFFPDRLLGRGITMMNFLLIGGAGIIQIGSGWMVDALRAAKWPPEAVFAALHGSFALLLAAALVIYLGSREKA